MRRAVLLWDSNAAVAHICRGFCSLNFPRYLDATIAATTAACLPGGVRSPCGGTDWLSPLWVVPICGVFMLQPPGVRNVKSAGEKRPQRPLSIPSLWRLIRSYGVGLGLVLRHASRSDLKTSNERFAVPRCFFLKTCHR